PVIAAQRIVARPIDTRCFFDHSGRALVDSFGQESKGPHIQWRCATEAKIPHDLALIDAGDGWEFWMAKLSNEIRNVVLLDDVELILWSFANLPTGRAHLIEVAIGPHESTQFFVAFGRVLRDDKQDVSRPWLFIVGLVVRFIVGFIVEGSGRDR